MAIRKVAVHFGPPNPERNRPLFESCLSAHQPPAVDFLYIVAAELRQRQLADYYLKVHACCFETPVLTFGQLLQSLFEFIPVDLVIDEDEKRSLVLEILSTEEIGALKPNPSLVPFLSQYITFFKSRNLTEKEQLRLYYAQKKWALGPTEEALIHLFTNYQQALDNRGLEDWEGANGLLYDQLLTGSSRVVGAYPDLRRLVLEGLVPFSTVEKGVLSLILQDIEEVDVSLACSDLATPRDLTEELEYLPTTEIEWVRHSACSASSERLVLNPASREQEISLVARMIAEARELDPALSYSSFALVAGQPDKYTPHIREIFSKHGLPYSFYRGRSGTEGILLALMLRFIRLLVNDFELNQLFDFLLSPGLKLPEGLAGSDLRLVEKVAIRSGVSGNFPIWSELLPGFIEASGSERDNPGSESLSRLGQTCQKLIELVGGFRVDTGHSRSMLEWLRAVCKRLQILVPAVSSGPGLLHRSENLLLMDLFRSIKKEASVRNDPLVGLQEFIDLVESRVLRVRAYSDFTEEAVLVAQPWEIQHLELDRVFWVGLVEGEFPSHPGQHIFLEGIHTSQWGMMSWQQKQEEDRRLYELLVSSNRQIVCTCPKVVGERAALPSPLLLKGTVELQSAGRIDPWPLVSVQDRPDLAVNVRRGREAQRDRESLLVSPFFGFFSSEKALSEYHHRFFETEILLAPSRLEEYVQCGYRYFLRHVLRLEPITAPQDRVALETGRLLHRVLCRFMGSGFVDPSALAEECRAEWQAGQARRMSQILDDEFLGLNQRELGPNAFWEDRKQKLSRGLASESKAGVLAQFIDQQWDHLRVCSNDALELALGPIPLGAISQHRGEPTTIPVALHGKIDRVDEAPDGLWVIDYKTGASPHTRVQHGWGFQLPLYSFMLESEQGVNVSTMMFYSLTHPGEVGMRPIVARNASQSLSSELIGYYKNKALAVAAQLHGAQFPVALMDRTKAGCRSCPFRQVCRYDGRWVLKAREDGRFLRDEPICARGKWILEPARASQKGPHNSDVKR